MGKTTIRRTAVLVVLGAAGAATAFVLPASSSRTQNAELHGGVANPAKISGPTGTIAPGRYDFVVDDNSTIHNFHLIGPGVDESTGVSSTGQVTWTVRLRSGTYVYHCDPHQSFMHGSFDVQGEDTTTESTETSTEASTSTVATTTTESTETETTTEPETSTDEQPPVPAPRLLAVSSRAGAVGFRVRVSHRVSAKLVVARDGSRVAQAKRTLAAGVRTVSVRLPHRAGVYRLDLWLVDANGPDAHFSRRIRVR